MKRRPLKTLLFPALVLLIGVIIGLVAEYAVGQWQAWGFYGLARPVADLTLLIGAIWLVVALIRLLPMRRRR